jgi:acyl-CoA synthetase (AMP-forming)/AMP-acid ligase II
VNDEERLAVVQEVERTQLRTVDRDEVLQAVRAAVSQQHGIRVHTLVLTRPATVPKTSSDKIRRSTCRDMLLKGDLVDIGDQQQAACTA